MKKDINRKLVIATMLSLTLGLAPFFPEPHIVGKVRWIMGGGEGMGTMDYFDLLFHGAPWIYMIMLLAVKLLSK